MAQTRSQRRFGLGWRPVHAGEIGQLDAGRIDWLELVSENVMGFGGRPRRFVEALRADYPMACHGVSLSLGSQDPLRHDYLKSLKHMCDSLEPDLVSDHLAWTSWKGKQSYDLLPLPRTEETLLHLCSRIHFVQDFLQRPLVLENPSAYLDFAGAAYSDAEFLAELCRRTGCQVLLDLNNCIVNQKNLGWDPLAYLKLLRPEWVRQFHLAGHQRGQELTIDTHDAPVADEVWPLFQAACQAFPEADVIVEWDEHIPPLQELLVELDKARQKEQLASAKAPYSPDLGCRSPAAKVRGESPPLALIQEQLFLQLTDRAERSTSDFLSGISPGSEAAQTYHKLAYGTRLLDLLQKTYPRLQSELGLADFAQIMRLFVEDRRSDPYIIDFVGEGLSAFLLEPCIDLFPWRDREYLAELARWEWTLFSFPFLPDDRRKPLDPQVMTTWDPHTWETTRFFLSQDVMLWESYWDFREEYGDRSRRAKAHRLLGERNQGPLLWHPLTSEEAEIWQRLASGATLAELLELDFFRSQELSESIRFLWQSAHMARLAVESPSAFPHRL